MVDVINRSNQCLRFVLAEAPKEAHGAPPIEFVPADKDHLASTHAPELLESTGHRTVPLARPSTALANHSSWQAEAGTLNAKNISYLEWAVPSSLVRLSASVGRIEMRAKLGAFVLTRHTVGKNKANEPDMRSVREFWEMIRREWTMAKLLRLCVDNLFVQVATN